MKRQIVINITYDPEGHVPSTQELDAQLEGILQRNNLMEPTGTEIVDQYDMEVKEVQE